MNSSRSYETRPSDSRTCGLPRPKATPQFGCVTGPDSGAMGLHYVNGDLVKRGELDPTRPQIVIYEPASDGTLKLIGADFLLVADAWDKKKQGPPELMGQLFHYWESPNRFVPGFHTLHVWAWKSNPNGAFVNWYPNVSCQQFNPQARDSFSTRASNNALVHSGGFSRRLHRGSRLTKAVKTKETDTYEYRVVPAIDMDRLNAFIGQFVTDLGAAVHAGMVVIGEKLGLYKALAQGQISSLQLARKHGTDERYVREWLASQAAGGYIVFDKTTKEFSLTENRPSRWRPKSVPPTCPEHSNSP